MATSAWHDASRRGVAGGGRAVAAQSDGGKGRGEEALSFAMASSDRMRDAAQEVLGALVLRRAQQLARHALLDDGAAVDEDDPVGHLAGNAHLVGDDRS